MRIQLSDDLLGGLVLALAAVAGVVAMNVGAISPLYTGFLEASFGVVIGSGGLTKSVLHWINDGLMAVFFLLIALEIKSEIVAGSLSEWRRAALPVYGAFGGMIVPALIFLGIVGLESAEARGWAIPAATDIAFAIGVLSVFRARVPPVLRTFLLTLAVVDDLGAIVIIALFYTADLALDALAVGAALVVALVLLNRVGCRRLLPYLAIGAVLWFFVYKSGVHATLAGVALGFAIPMAADSEGRSPLWTLEHALKGPVTFAIMPLFAFANAGVPLGGMALADLGQPLVLAIALGLFAGKQIGVFGVCQVVIRLGLAEAPRGATMLQLYGVALLAGIGFTMSLFIGGLAFPAADQQNDVRLGVILGSLVSGIVGSALLVVGTSRRAAARPSPLPGDA